MRRGAGRFITVNGGKLYYADSGSGENVVLLLHGNTASSRMFDPVTPLYERRFRVLTLDFLGHGNSERLKEFPADLWFDQALQAARLLDALGLRSVNVIGSSGGAPAALNLALERPELTRRVIADSFEGEKSLDAVVSILAAERSQAKSDPSTVRFWRECHGEDWEAVVDNDTRAMLRHHAAIGSFFHRDVAALAAPVLFTASLEDEFAEIARFPENYAAMSAKMSMGRMHIFPTGGHPAMLSNSEEFAELAERFFLHSEDLPAQVCGPHSRSFAF